MRRAWAWTGLMHTARELRCAAAASAVRELRPSSTQLARIARSSASPPEARPTSLSISSSISADGGSAMDD
jgi:hypothetical protein